jgi:CBS domain-containing protein
VLSEGPAGVRRNVARGTRSNDARNLRCGEVMSKPRMLGDSASLSRVIHVMTEREWDHIFLVDDERVPVGRVHAVDLLKMVDRKRVNRDTAWAEAVPALQCVSLPPLAVKENTPLLKATVLMLTHDLNQLAVVDGEGALIGMVSHATVARHLPRYIL